MYGVRSIPRYTLVMTTRGKWLAAEKRAGKPHLSAYETALVEAQRLRDTDVSPDRILAIGDALRTDIKGAHLAGIDALFVAGGIHRHDVMTGHEIDPERLANLFHAEAPPAIAATPHLVW